jgi:predicted anti-sigma-YlaC factor YlaD
MTAMHTRTRTRLGWIVYLGCCVGAALIVLATIAGILLNIGNENGAAIVRTLVIASLAWGIGRTAFFFLVER